MWTYEKMLQYPVKIERPNPALAKVIITQFGGPDGELAAANRYLSQRYSMPYKEVKGMLRKCIYNIIYTFSYGWFKSPRLYWRIYYKIIQ